MASTPIPTTTPARTPGEQAANEWTVDTDGVLVATAGHLHPGGLHTDLWATRDGTKVPLFTSTANYFEPAGAVSWDVAMTATPPSWAVAVHKGDQLSISATYDSARASWYESMGIMVVWMADATPATPAGADPFTTDVAVAGMLTHGHLPENDNHGGQPSGDKYQDLTSAPSEPVNGAIPIVDWVYSQGDMALAKAVPTVKAGQTITFTNQDAPLGNGIWHTITACKAPCDLSHGHRLSRGRRGHPVRLGRARRRRPTDGRADRLDHPCRSARRDLHLLLPDPPADAWRVPGRQQRERLTSDDASRGTVPTATTTGSSWR